MRLGHIIVLASIAGMHCSKPEGEGAPLPETPSLPSSFPNPIPVYPHTRLTAVKIAISDAGRRLSLAELETPDPVSTVSEFYDERTKFFSRNNVETTPTSHLLNLTENERKFDLYINISRSSGKTIIHIEAAPF